MKKKTFSILGLVMALSLCLLTACGGGGGDSSKDGGSEDNGIVGLWESEEWGGICL